MKRMPERLTRIVALLSVALLLAGGQCVASCSIAMCASHQQHSSGHCHKRGGEPSHHDPVCPHQEQSVVKSANRHASLALQELGSIALAPEIDHRPSLAVDHLSATISPPLIPALDSISVLRV
jgi:hypothetical protein